MAECFFVIKKMYRSPYEAEISAIRIINRGANIMRLKGIVFIFSATIFLALSSVSFADIHSILFSPLDSNNSSGFGYESERYTTGNNAYIFQLIKATNYYGRAGNAISVGPGYRFYLNSARSGLFYSLMFRTNMVFVADYPPDVIFALHPSIGYAYCHGDIKISAEYELGAGINMHFGSDLIVYPKPGEPFNGTIRLKLGYSF